MKIDGKVDAVKYAKSNILITIRIKRVSELKARLWMFKQLIKLAQLICPADCEITRSEKE